jgi:hypothetical protein
MEDHKPLASRFNGIGCDKSYSAAAATSMTAAKKERPRRFARQRSATRGQIRA